MTNRILRIIIVASLFLANFCTAQDNTTLSATDNGNTTTAPNAGTDTTTASPVAATAGCTSSDDCDSGLFCSAGGTCEMLNCTNWATMYPSDDVPYSEVPCNAEAVLEGSLAYDEGDQFCGWDGNCYTYGCENWYTYGPVAFTGYDSNNPQELSCEDYEDGYDENMNAVINGCRPYIPGNKAPEAKNWVLYFNQKCTANPRGSDEFTCYQLKPNTDYSDFLAETARLNLGSCDREIFENEQPLFWYETVLRQQRKGGDILYKDSREETRNTPSFDPSEADKSMYALIVSDDDAPAPNQPQPEEPSQEEDGAPSFAGLATSLSLAATISSLLFL